GLGARCAVSVLVAVVPVVFDELLLEPEPDVHPPARARATTAIAVCPRTRDIRDPARRPIRPPDKKLERLATCGVGRVNGPSPEAAPAGDRCTSRCPVARRRRAGWR